jgi:hypothetical protein
MLLLHWRIALATAICVAACSEPGLAQVAQTYHPRSRHGKRGSVPWRRRPEIVTTPSGPTVFHSDFTLATAVKPAKGCEVLIVRATGLGPAVPGVNPGQPFPTDALRATSGRLMAQQPDGGHSIERGLDRRTGGELPDPVKNLRRLRD